MSRPGFRASHPIWPEHSTGNNAAGLPIGKTPTETYVEIYD